jgi:glycosyltransferase involved in cell wall biosynthesis
VVTAFSVVVPLYEKAAYVERAVASVLAQRRPATEVIVVDDGSTDGGGALVARSFPEVVVIRQENQGEGAARNTGAAAATSTWVAFLDADDVWLPGHLEELAAVVDAVPEAHLVGTGHVQVWDREPTPPVVEIGRRERVDYFIEAAQRIGVVCSSSAAVRRDSLLAVGGFGVDPAGTDLACWARLALLHPVAVSRAETVLYSRGVGGIMERSFAEERTIGRLDRQQLDALAQTPVSPSAAVVAAALAAGGFAPPSSSLARYLDARVANAMKTYVATGDLAAARRLRRTLRGRPQRRDLVTVGVTYLPTGLVRAVLAARQRARRGTS